MDASNMVMNSFMAKREARGLNINVEEEKKKLEALLLKKHRQDLENQQNMRDLRTEVFNLLEYFQKEMIKFNENKIIVKKKIDFRAIASKMLLFLAQWHRCMMKHLRKHERESTEVKQILDLDKTNPKVFDRTSASPRNASQSLRTRLLGRTRAEHRAAARGRRAREEAREAREEKAQAGHHRGVAGRRSAAEESQQ